MVAFQIDRVMGARIPTTTTAKPIFAARGSCTRLRLLVYPQTAGDWIVGVNSITPTTRREALGERSLPWGDRRPLDATDSAIGFALDRGCIKSQELTAPPETLCPFLGHGCEPILPNHRTYLAWRLMRKGILLKKNENVIVIGKQPHFGAGHNRMVAP